MGLSVPHTPPCLCTSLRGRWSHYFDAAGMKSDKMTRLYLGSWFRGVLTHHGRKRYGDPLSPGWQQNVAEAAHIMAGQQAENTARTRERHNPSNLPKWTASASAPPDRPTHILQVLQLPETVPPEGKDYSKDEPVRDILEANHSKGQI